MLACLSKLWWVFSFLNSCRKVVFKKAAFRVLGWNELEAKFPFYGRKIHSKQNKTMMWIEIRVFSTVSCYVHLTLTFPSGPPRDIVVGSRVEGDSSHNFQILAFKLPAGPKLPKNNSWAERSSYVLLNCYCRYVPNDCYSYLTWCPLFPARTGRFAVEVAKTKFHDYFR